MPPFGVTQAFATCVIFVVVVVLSTAYRRSAVSLIQGPPSSSWLLGHEKALSAQHQVGDTEFSWFCKYGSTLRIKDCFGVNRLMTADPKAIQHTLHTSGYRFPKTEDINHASLLMAGNSIGTVGGATHQRHLRTFASLFQRCRSRSKRHLQVMYAKEITRLWTSMNDSVASVLTSSARVYSNLLQCHVIILILWLGAFGYSFGTVDGESNDLAYQLNHLFSESIGPSTGAIIYAALWRRLPGWFMHFINFHGKQGARFLRFQYTSKRIGCDILTTALSDGKDGKNTLNILVCANAETDEKRRLDEDEVLSQVGATMIAGHETATSTLSWVLYELSRRPSQQDRIRKEIAEVRVRGDGQLTPQDYDRMSFLNAVIKEGLRLHPILPFLSSEALYDDVIPFSEPVITRMDAKLTEIPVEKGQTVRISIAYYNRNPAVWGNDADQWNPDRFLEGRCTRHSEKVSVGVYANVDTLSQALSADLSHIFSIMEMQTILTDLMANFVPGGHGGQKSCGRDHDDADSARKGE
ncbi:cytochrome P450 [Mucidula mucida]|nr:cytochrome P450 [Mucidula mucida]